MPRKPAGALEALATHQQQQREASVQGEVLRQAAALELGLIVLDTGGARLGRDGVRQAIAAASNVEEGIGVRRARAGKAAAAESSS